MKLIDSEYWPIIALAFTTIIGPIITYWLQAGRIEKLRVGLEESSLQLSRNAQLIDMFTSLNRGLAEYWAKHENYTELLNTGDRPDNPKSHNLRLKWQEMQVKKEEIVQIRNIIF